MSDKKPFVIVIAGMYRTGSTWAFNACRLLAESTGKTVHSGFWGDLYDPNDPAEIHVVKVHQFDVELAERADFIVQTWRNLPDIFESLYRIGDAWLPVKGKFIRGREQENLQKFGTWVYDMMLWRYRAGRTNGVILNDGEVGNKVIFNQLAYRIGSKNQCRVASDAYQEKVHNAWQKLKAIKPPTRTDRTDPVTLLWYNHIAKP